MKRLFLLIWGFFLVFSFPVYATDETTQEETYEDSFTLQDVKEGRHLPEFMDFVEYTGAAADFVYSVYTKDIIGAVLSSMMAYKNPVKDWADEHSLILQDSLMGDVDFCESIKFLPKVMAVEWDKSTSDAVQKNENVVNRFTKPATSCADGFYPCLYVNYWYALFGGNEDYYYWFVSDLSDSGAGTNTYFCNLGTYAFFCSFASEGLNYFTVDAYLKHSLPISNNYDGGIQYNNIHCDGKYTVNGKTYCYGGRGIGGIGMYGDFNEKFPQVYQSKEEALEAFYGFSASTEPVPNGEGYIRPIPEGKKIRATSKNIFNTDFSIYIQNNYNTYGADFVNVPIDDYPYTKPDPDTPSWWYDIYYPVDIPQDTLSDLTNIEFNNPDLTLDTSFINACFSAIPDRLALLFVSFSLLGAAMFIFKKG